MRQLTPEEIKQRELTQEKCKKAMYAGQLAALAMIPIFVELFCSMTIREHWKIEHARYIGGAVGAIAGVILCLLFGKHRPIRQQFRSFDLRVPLMFFLLVETGGKLLFSLTALILSRFSSVTPAENTRDTLAQILLTVIVTPILEELIFRTGMVGVLKKSGSRLLAVLFPAMLFMMMHSSRNLPGRLDVLNAGIFLAVCYYETGNILYAMLIHSLHNLAALFFSVTGGTETGDRLIGLLQRRVSGYGVLRLPVLIVFAVIFVAGMIWLLRVFPKKYAAAEPAEQVSGDDGRAG